MRLMFDNLEIGYRWSNVLVDRNSADGITMQFTLVQNEFSTHSVQLLVPHGGCLNISWYNRDDSLANVRHWKNIFGRLISCVPCKLL